MQPLGKDHDFNESSILDALKKYAALFDQYKKCQSDQEKCHTIHEFLDHHKFSKTLIYCVTGELQ